MYFVTTAADPQIQNMTTRRHKKNTGHPHGRRGRLKRTPPLCCLAEPGGQGFGGFVASPNKAIASDARLRDKQQNTREPQCPPLVSPSPEGHKVAFSFALGMPEAHLDFSCDPSCMEVPALALFSRGAFAFQRLRQESYRSASGVACVLRALSTALAIGNGYQLQYWSTPSSYPNIASELLPTGSSLACESKTWS